MAITQTPGCGGLGSLRAGYRWVSSDNIVKGPEPLVFERGDLHPNKGGYQFAIRDQYGFPLIDSARIPSVERSS
jgi:hypothetical protein